MTRSKMSQLQQNFNGIERKASLKLFRKLFEASVKVSVHLMLKIVFGEGVKTCK